MSSTDLFATAEKIGIEIAAYRGASPSTRTEFAAQICFPLINLARDINPQSLAQVIATFMAQANQTFAPSPSTAFGYAYVSYTLACQTTNSATQARSELSLARTLNRLGDFRDALNFGDQAAMRFEQSELWDEAARAYCAAAWASTFIGDLKRADRALECARKNDRSGELTPTCDWIRARTLRERAQFDQAQGFLEQARVGFLIADKMSYVAHCEREQFQTALFRENPESQAQLELARQTFQRLGLEPDVLLCDLFKALSIEYTNKYLESTEVLLVVRAGFAERGMQFFASLCDNQLGINYRHQSEYVKARQMFEQAREYFRAHAIDVQISAVNINLGNLHFDLGDYAQAIQLYQEAAALFDPEERPTRHALIQMNLGIAFAKQGHFARAVEFTERAFRFAEAHQQYQRQGLCRINLAYIYAALGQLDRALEHLDSARQIFIEQNLPEYLADCLVQLGDLCWAIGESDEAIKFLNEAADICTARGFHSLRAAALLHLAQASAGQAEWDTILAMLEMSRAIFLDHHQSIDAGLVDATQGELCLARHEVPQAADWFHRAQQAIPDGLKSLHWRIDYGLARCHQAAGEHERALELFLRATNALAETREELGSEDFSNRYFAHWGQVFEDALALALELGAPAQALDIIEASKARAFIALLSNRNWKLRDARANADLAGLVERERELRLEVQIERSHTVTQGRSLDRPLKLSKDLDAISDAGLTHLQKLKTKHEETLAQLRVNLHGLRGVALPPAFALSEFQTACDALGTGWVALDYFLQDARLVIARVDMRGVRVIAKSLSNADLRALARCGAITPTPVTYSDTDCWQHAYRLLIPEQLEADTLLISRHGALHGIPFHALKNGNRFLMQDHVISYTPNLQALQLLLTAKNPITNFRALVCGASEFGERLGSLRGAETEAARVFQALGNRGEYLWNQAGTREKIIEWNDSGELARFSVIHFATHTARDAFAPHQSRIIFPDGELTTADVLDLNLNARLVTLAGCESAAGRPGQGDEIVGLARAFFYAGADAVLATLWRTEDALLAKFMPRFYEHWLGGMNLAQALREMQLEMIAAGCQPYDWAPYVLMGLP